MTNQAFRIICYSYLYLTATAWSTVVGNSIAGGSNLLGDNERDDASSKFRVKPLFQAKNENADADNGECVTSPSSSLSRKPKAGDIVTFTLHRFNAIQNNDNDDKDNDDASSALSGSPPKLIIEPLFDTTGTQQLLLHGGNYLPGLHQLLSTMTPSETIRSATIDAGYGAWNPELEFQISTSQIGDAIDASLVTIGTVLQLGNGMECRVTGMTEEGWTLDANPALAGAAYEVDVTLEGVEEGPKNWEYYSKNLEDDDDDDDCNEKYEVATFALGCFWGGELAYQRMPGVISTHVGYTQGSTPNPTYKEVCSGTTGHTEAIRLVYDPTIASYRSLVQLGLDRLGNDIYKLNQVGNDKGTQYRHGIYYHTDEQKQVAEELLLEYGSGTGREVVTEVEKASVFYMAEDYHQQYLLKGGQSAKKGAVDTIRCYG